MRTGKLGTGVLGSLTLGAIETGSSMFVVDRTQEHVDLLKRLKSIGYQNLSPEEQNVWYAEASKGAYNYTDLNRVETAVELIAANLGLSLTTKTDWTVWDIPTRASMERYLSNVVAIRNASPGGMNFPDLPESMADLTYESANAIETVLLMAYSRSQFIRSGEIFCGEV